MYLIPFDYLVMEYDAIILTLRITLVVTLIIIHRHRNVFNFHQLIILHLFMMVCYS